METMTMQPDNLIPLHQQLIPSSLEHAFGISPVGTGQQLDGVPSGDAGAPSCSAGVRASQKRCRDSAGAPSASGAAAAACAGGPLQPASTALAPAASSQLEQVGLMACSSGMATQPQQQPQAMPVAPPPQQQQQLQQQHTQLTQPGCSSMATTSSMSGGYQPGTAAAAMAAQAAVMSQLRGFPAAAAYHFAGQKGPLVPYALGPSGMALQGMAGMGIAPMGMFAAAQAADFGKLRPAQAMTGGSQQMDDEGDDTTARALKRPRLVWTPQLHKLFEEAVHKLGIDKAVPKTIMTYMKVEGLTRENVASHLQKYRLSLKKGSDKGEKGDKGAGGEEAAGAEAAPAAEVAAGGSGATEPGGGSEAAAAGAAAAAGDAAAGGSPGAAPAAAAAAATDAATPPAASS